MPNKVWKSIEGFSSPLIAKIFKVKRRQISRIISREQWSHI